MSLQISKPLEELPAFLSTISMVVDDRAAIVRELVQAERTSPSCYQPARDLFLSILKGEFSHEKALEQAKYLTDAVEARCAVAVLTVAADFLKSQSPSHLLRLEFPLATLPTGMALKVGPVWVRHWQAEERLLVLHLWQSPLTQRQLGAAGRLVRDAVYARHPRYATSEIDFISVATPDLASGRRFHCYGWEALKVLNDAENLRFWRQFGEAWDVYLRRGPRIVKSRRSPDLFGR